MFDGRICVQCGMVRTGVARLRRNLGFVMSVDARVLMQQGIVNMAVGNVRRGPVRDLRGRTGWPCVEYVCGVRREVVHVSRTAVGANIKEEIMRQESARELRFLGVAVCACHVGNGQRKEGVVVEESVVLSIMQGNAKMADLHRGAKRVRLVRVGSRRR